MVVGCCDANFDIFENKKMETLKSSLEKGQISDGSFDSIYLASKEYGKVKFIIKNMPINDTLICVYTDFSGFPCGYMILKNGSYGWFGPSKGYYGNSNDFIVFAKKKTNLEFKKEVKCMISWDSPDFSVYFDKLRKFQIRIFNEERVIIEYDYRTKKTRLKFMK